MVADARFFYNAGPFSLADIAKQCECAIEDQDGADKKQIRSVASLDQAENADLGFLDNIKYKNSFYKSKAGACIVSHEMASEAPEGMILLISDAPYKSYAMAASLFYPQNLSHTLPPRVKKVTISGRAHISENAVIGEGCHIEDGCVIKDGVEIGDNTIIEANTVIDCGVKIGQSCHIGASCTICYALIADTVRIHNGVRIGQDGFGFAFDKGGFVPVPQLGRVVIQEHVNIGANTTIDRGSGPDTLIGAGSIIDNLVQIGHNVKIGQGCIVVAQVGISGSTEIGNYTVIGGQAGIAGHLKIGQSVKIGAQSGVSKSIPDGLDVIGYPAQERRSFWKGLATLRRLSREKKIEVVLKE